MILLDEIFRVMVPDGRLQIGYPEFTECAKAFMENVAGERWSWWVQTLYGTQDDAGQFHVAPITKEHLTHQLQQVGFCRIEHKAEMFNSLITCYKGEAVPWHPFEQGGGFYG